MATSSDHVKVIGTWPSPYVNRVVMALKIKSIDHEFVEVNPQEKNGILVEYNPVHKKVPVLIHGEMPICESLVIVHYIDEKWPNGPSILPLDPYDCAIARFWAAYIDDKWVPLLKNLRDVKGAGDEAKIEILEKIAEGFLMLEAAFVECSKGKGFFGGDNVGYLDIALGCFLGWFKVTENLIGVKFLDETKTPHLQKWAERMYSDHNPVKDVMMDPQALLGFYEKLMAHQSNAEA